MVGRGYPRFQRVQLHHLACGVGHTDVAGDFFHHRSDHDSKAGRIQDWSSDTRRWTAESFSESRHANNGRCADTRVSNGDDPVVGRPDQQAGVGCTHRYDSIRCNRLDRRLSKSGASESERHDRAREVFLAIGDRHCYSAISRLERGVTGADGTHRSIL